MCNICQKKDRHCWLQVLFEARHSHSMLCKPSASVLDAYYETKLRNLFESSMG